MKKIRSSKVTYGIKDFESNLNWDQKEAVKTISENDLCVVTGKAGSGKTMIAVFCAVQKFLNKEVERIVITRPTVSDEEIGFLPGTLEEKMDPWVAPIFHNLNMLLGSEQAGLFVKEGVISIKPIAYMRGQTFTDATVIVDEAQNITHKQTEMLIGRLGVRSNMIVCGDICQKDLSKRQVSGLPFLISCSKKLPNVASVELTSNHRHTIVEPLLSLYYEYNNSQVYSPE